MTRFRLTASILKNSFSEEKPQLISYCILYLISYRTSDLGTQSLDNGIVKVSDACEVFLLSIVVGGNLTVAIPSCSLIDATTPMLPAIPLPKTYNQRRYASIPGLRHKKLSVKHLADSTHNCSLHKLQAICTLLCCYAEAKHGQKNQLPSKGIRCERWEITWTSEPILIVSLKPPRAQRAATACRAILWSLASFLPLLLPFSKILSAYFPSCGMYIRARDRTWRQKQKHQIMTSKRDSDKAQHPRPPAHTVSDELFSFSKWIM